MLRHEQHDQQVQHAFAEIETGQLLRVVLNIARLVKLIANAIQPTGKLLSVELLEKVPTAVN